MELYEYLKQKLKQKSIHLEQFAKMCGFSKSTLYRYMKGFAIIPDKTINKIVSILELNDEEKQALYELMNKIYTKNTIDSFNYTLYKYIFSSYMENNSKFNLVVYKNDSYIISASEIFKDIIALKDSKNFLCEINIIGCLDEEFIKVIHNFIINKNIDSNCFKIEHIINISNSFYNDTMQAFKTIFPMMKYYGYNVYYTDFDTNSSLSILDDCLIIKYSFAETVNHNFEKYIFINFAKSKFSGCYISKDKNLYNFIMQNYNWLKQKCVRGCTKINNINYLINNEVAYKKDTAIYSIQSTVDYSKIPIDVLEQELARYSDKELINLVNFISGKKNNLQMAKEYIDNMKYNINELTQYSKINKNIDIYTKEGIRNFISTGYLYVNNIKIKPFLKKSIYKIINYILERNLDSEDNYKMYISNISLPAQLVLRVINNYGINIIYNFSSKDNIIISNSLIENKSLFKIFNSFVENYIPTTNLMTNEEAYNYIQGLLKTYC